MNIIEYTFFGIFLLSISASQVLLTSAASAGQIYHCKGEDGSMSFQSTPCTDETVKVDSTKQSRIQTKLPVDKRNSKQDSKTANKVEEERSESVTLSKTMLLGTWTDFPDDPIVRGLWVFNSSSLRVTNHLGVSYTHKYELAGNILIIHHAPIPGLNQKAWKQKIVIEEFDGKRITFGEGGPAGTRYIYKIK